MMATTKWPEALIERRNDGRDWARRILERENAGERFTVTVMDMAKRALGLPTGAPQ
ncbi:hypothetical protein DFLDMN_001511 [Cupriavidus sp. H19C3]|uniref:hypothetical protein n=1 Tax=Cupriavidus sp. H19C3 TaxID=3241603 RepID=UPI003BF8C9B4